MKPNQIILPGDERVMLTGLWAGLFTLHVCVVPDATDEEILATCNNDEHLVNPDNYKWTKVLRTKEDFDSLGLSNNWEDGKPGTCVECPPRIHLCVR